MAAGLSKETRQKMATEIGLPATGFITACDDKAVHAHFHSTVTEYPMCGHGTICLMSHLVEMGVLHWRSNDSINVDLHLPTTIATVEIFKRDSGYPLVMLDIKPPSFHQYGIDSAQLANLLGLRPQDYDPRLPIETARGDFVHLVVPLKGLDAMRRLTPDFTGISQLLPEFGIQTVAVFCSETERANATIHVRDFCPGVGVAESAAAGTTNSALTSYLIRHGILPVSKDGLVNVLAEQGHEINRPSSIYSTVRMDGENITRLQVGGEARKVIDGMLHIPDDNSPTKGNFHVE
ncbi:MAG: PhzF family phenazine biosynthesis protein [Gammaproteobacteria bacterium]|nr:PhzF family phenazine biosynthesis protein [Gammaproteobacteria bacterium]